MTPIDPRSDHPLARALPEGGRLITLELDPHHAEVARANIARAGLADRVEIRTGDWFGGWDGDLLVGYMQGSLGLPFRPRTSA